MGLLLNTAFAPEFRRPEQSTVVIGLRQARLCLHADQLKGNAEANSGGQKSLDRSLE